MSLLIIPASDKTAEKPYTFALTGINVYSFEEALYHVYNFWRESSEDFISAEFISWLNDYAGLPHLAESVKRLTGIKSYVERITAFLTLTDYFDEEDISSIKAEMSNWEREHEWESLKVRADYLLEQNASERAVILYKRANELAETPELLNNTAIAFMKLYKFDTAVSYFENALSLDEGNISITLNLAEGAVYNHDYEKAAKILESVSEICADNPTVSYLYGEIEFEKGNFKEAADLFERALERAMEQDGTDTDFTSHFACRLADAYAKLRLFSKALACLDGIDPKNKKCYVKYAEISAQSYNMPAAINAIYLAIALELDDFALYIELAKYCRLSNDIDKASAAIETAMKLSPQNGLAKLESARIKRAGGNSPEYRKTLYEILDGFKREYREAAEL